MRKLASWSLCVHVWLCVIVCVGPSSKEGWYSAVLCYSCWSLLLKRYKVLSRCQNCQGKLHLYKPLAEYDKQSFLGPSDHRSPEGLRKVVGQCHRLNNHITAKLQVLVSMVLKVHKKKVSINDGEFLYTPNYWHIKLCINESCFDATMSVSFDVSSKNTKTQKKTFRCNCFHCSPLGFISSALHNFLGSWLLLASLPSL